MGDAIIGGLGQRGTDFGFRSVAGSVLLVVRLRSSAHQREAVGKKC